MPLGIHSARRLDALIKEKSSLSLLLLLFAISRKKQTKTPKEFRVASRAAPSRRRRRRSALCLFLSRIMAGVDLAMEGIPRYVKVLFFFFFCLLQSTHSKRDMMFQINNNMRFSTKIRRCFNVRNVSLSLHACAKRVNSSPLSVFFQKQIRKTCALTTLRKQQRIWNIQNRRDLRFTEREKVAHHRTDYQVTLFVVARRVV